MKSKIKSIVVPLLAALIWGTAFVFQTDNTAPTFIFLTSRSYVAVPFLLVLTLFTTKWDFKHLLSENTKKGTRDLWLGGVICGLALFVASYCQQKGMDLGVGAGKSGFITAFYMILVPVIGLFFGQKNKLNIWFGAVIALIGLYLICMGDENGAEPADMLILACSLFFSLQIHAIDHFSPKCNCVKLSCVQFLVCGTLSVVSALIFNTSSFSDLGSILAENAYPILFCGIFSSGIAYTLQMVAQKGTNPTVVSILLCMESVFSVIAEAIIKHSFLSTRAYIGCTIMFVAVLSTQIDIFAIITKEKKY